MARAVLGSRCAGPACIGPVAQRERGSGRPDAIVVAAAACFLQARRARGSSHWGPGPFLASQPASLPAADRFTYVPGPHPQSSALQRFSTEKVFCKIARRGFWLRGVGRALANGFVANWAALRLQLRRLFPVGGSETARGIDPAQTTLPTRGALASGPSGATLGERGRRTARMASTAARRATFRPLMPRPAARERPLRHSVRSGHQLTTTSQGQHRNHGGSRAISRWTSSRSGNWLTRMRPLPQRCTKAIDSQLASWEDNPVSGISSFVILRTAGFGPPVPCACDQLHDIKPHNQTSAVPGDRGTIDIYLPVSWTTARRNYFHEQRVQQITSPVLRPTTEERLVCTDQGAVVVVVPSNRYSATALLKGAFRRISASSQYFLLRTAVFPQRMRCERPKANSRLRGSGTNACCGARRTSRRRPLLRRGAENSIQVCKRLFHGPGMKQRLHTSAGRYCTNLHPETCLLLLSRRMQTRCYYATRSPINYRCANARLKASMSAPGNTRRWANLRSSRRNRKGARHDGSHTIQK